MLKSQGSAKIGGICTAHVRVKINDTGSVIVYYCSLCIGHEKEIAHLCIPENVKLSIATKLQQDVDIGIILGDIHDDVAGDFG